LRLGPTTRRLAPTIARESSRDALLAGDTRFALTSRLAEQRLFPHELFDGRQALGRGSSGLQPEE
jgi:hypothetical protein